MSIGRKYFAWTFKRPCSRRWNQPRWKQLSAHTQTDGYSRWPSKLSGAILVPEFWSPFAAFHYGRVVLHRLVTKPKWMAVAQVPTTLVRTALNSEHSYVFNWVIDGRLWNLLLTHETALKRVGALRYAFIVILITGIKVKDGGELATIMSSISNRSTKPRFEDYLMFVYVLLWNFDIVCLNVRTHSSVRAYRMFQVWMMVWKRDKSIARFLLSQKHTDVVITTATYCFFTFSAMQNWKAEVVGLNWLES